MPKPIDVAGAVQLGGPVVQRIDVQLLTVDNEVTVHAFRDPTGLIPVELEGSAERAAKVRVAMVIAGAHLRRVEQVSSATMEMLDFVMDQVLDDDGKAITGPDGTPLLGEKFIAAYQQLVVVRRGEEHDDDGQPAAEPEAAPQTD